MLIWAGEDLNLRPARRQRAVIAAKLPALLVILVFLDGLLTLRIGNDIQ